MKNKLIFWRLENFDLSQCVRELPYEGKSWWVCKTSHLPRLKKWVAANKEKFGENMTIKTTAEMDIKEINSLNYSDVNSYVIGETDVIPQLLDFDFKSHVCDWKLHTMIEIMGVSKHELESIGGAAYSPVPTYQVLIK